ncbi:MAG TPA: DNA recombination protein RmuC [Thermoguttaceae bacterium]|nr:DNA recombination protein RmuC [Thermoguttaceae bacterium]
MQNVFYILAFLFGLATGGGLVWLLLRGKIQHAFDRGQSDGNVERAALAERLDARQQTIDELGDKVRRLEQQDRERQTTEAGLKAKVVQLATTLEQERKQADEKLALVDDARQKLSDAFKAMAADALKSNNQSFLELAKTNLEKFQESAKGDLDKRQQAIGELVKPVRESLEKVDAKIREIEKDRAGAYQGLREQVGSLLESQKELRLETSNLVKALRRPQVRGRWGELQLKRVVEMAGMLDHCDFREQLSTEGEDGRLRPDMVVRLPANKTIVVDSKAPLTAYLEAVEAPDEETRTAKLKDHARQVRAHITALGRKSYFEQFEQSPEFVVLFLPGEVFFSAALEHDPGLIEFGVAERVIIASPTTLISLLRAVAYGWRHEQLAENARQISELGKDLYIRLATMGDHMSRLGKGLGSATDAYNKAVRSLESRVLVAARKFRDLGTTSGKTEIEELPPVETSPRMLQAPELIAGDEPEERKAVGQGLP